MCKTAESGKKCEERKGAADEQPGFSMRSHGEPGGNARRHNQPDQESRKKFHVQASYNTAEQDQEMFSGSPRPFGLEKCVKRNSGSFGHDRCDWHLTAGG